MQASRSIYHYLLVVLLWSLGVVPSQGAGNADTGRIEARLEELGIALPEAPSAVATYAPYKVVGNLVYIAGQGPMDDGITECRGKVGSDVTKEQGYQCARLTGLVILAQLKAACGGDLDRVVQGVKIGGFVNTAPGFTDYPFVINGASDLFVDVFGKRGLAARFAVGAASLPFNIPVEIDAVFEIKE